MKCPIAGGVGINIIKSAFEFKKIFRLPLSMGISLELVDYFRRASVTLIFGVISSVHP